MTERPIIFSGPMVRAILEGRKTQTRRTRGLNRINQQPDLWVSCGFDPVNLDWAFDNLETGERLLITCPYGVPGDRLWVRETWAGGAAKNIDGVDYRADGHDYGTDEDGKRLMCWRPSIHMPRWASRITLEVTDVRVQRVQEISEGDARAEGVDAVETRPRTGGEPMGMWSYRRGFSDVWDSINAKRGFGWDANPWVWAVTFRVVADAGK